MIRYSWWCCKRTFDMLTHEWRCTIYNFCWYHPCWLHDAMYINACWWLILNLYVGGAHAKTTLTGVTVGVDVSSSEKIWRTFQSLGDIAFAYSYSNVLIEIQVIYHIYFYICRPNKSWRKYTSFDIWKEKYLSEPPYTHACPWSLLNLARGRILYGMGEPYQDDKLCSPCFLLLSS